MTRRNFLKLLGISATTAIAQNILAKEIRNNIIIDGSVIKIRKTQLPPMHFNCRCIAIPLLCKSNNPIKCYNSP